MESGSPKELIQLYNYKQDQAPLERTPDLEGDWGARSGVGKRDRRGVEAKAVVRQHCQVLTIKVITEDRVSNGSHVHPQLVRPARHRSQLHARHR